jgi:hypothetical protein
MSLIDLNVTMQNGTGLGLFIKVEGNIYHFTQSGTQTMNLDPDDYISTIGGNEPTTASVTIQFIENGNILASQSFSTPVFFGYIPFTVN